MSASRDFRGIDGWCLSLKIAWSLCSLWWFIAKQAYQWYQVHFSECCNFVTTHEPDGQSGRLTDVRTNERECHVSLTLTHFQLYANRNYLPILISLSQAMPLVMVRFLVAGWKNLLHQLSYSNFSYRRLQLAKSVSRSEQHKCGTSVRPFVCQSATFVHELW